MRTLGLLDGPTLRSPEPEPQDDGLLDADPANLSPAEQAQWVARAEDWRLRELCLQLMGDKLRRRG